MPVVAGLRDPRRSAGAALRPLPRTLVGGEGDETADRLAAARAALRREAGHARRDDRRHDRRHRSDQGRAARALQLADELTMHYGLLPRANRGIFAINELPDLAGKIQVGLFNILQEGDVQIKGYPVRLPLDVLLVFTRQPRGLHRARQDHHAAQGPHRLRDPHALSGHARPGAWRSPRRRPGSSAATAAESRCPTYMREVVEELAFQARAGHAASTSARASASGCRSRVLENVVSNAERRALAAGEERRSCRASPTSTPPCRPSPASSNSSTRAN